MIAVNDFVASPSVGGSVILEYLSLLLLLIHLPFMATIIGGTVLSLLFDFLDKDKPNPQFRRFAQEIIAKVTINKAAGLMFGVIPLIGLILIFYQMLYQAPQANAGNWWIAIALITLGLAHIYIYRDTFARRDQHFLWHFGAGAGGLGLLALAYLVFFANKSFILYP